MAFANPVKSWRTKTDPVRSLRDINMGGLRPILFHCMSARLMVWSGVTMAICLACWAHNLVTVSTSSVYPPTHPSILPIPSHPPTLLYAKLMILQAVLKMSLKISQSNQLLYIYIYIYQCNDSYYPIMQILHIYY